MQGGGGVGAWCCLMDVDCSRAEAEGSGQGLPRQRVRGDVPGRDAVGCVRGRGTDSGWF